MSRATTSGMLAGLSARCAGQRHLGRPQRALPGLLPGGRGLDHAAVSGYSARVLPRSAAGRPARETLIALAADFDLAGAGGQRLGRGGEGVLEQLAAGGGRAAHRDAQREVALLRNAFLAAHQPGGLELHLELAAGKARRHRQRHRQQHGFFVAVVGQRADGDFFRRRPGDLARVDAGGQLPVELCGQARIARILPVGVPLGLVRELQAHPDRLAGLHALGRPGQQFGAHLVGRDHAGGAPRLLLPGRFKGEFWALATADMCAESYQKRSSEGGGQGGA